MRNEHWTVLGISSEMIPIPGGTNSGTDPDFGAYTLTVGDFHISAGEILIEQ